MSRFGVCEVCRGERLRSTLVFSDGVTRCSNRYQCAVDRMIRDARDKAEESAPGLEHYPAPPPPPEPPPAPPPPPKPPARVSAACPWCGAAFVYLRSSPRKFCSASHGAQARAAAERKAAGR